MVRLPVHASQWRSSGSTCLRFSSPEFSSVRCFFTSPPADADPVLLPTKLRGSRESRIVHLERVSAFCDGASYNVVSLKNAWDAEPFLSDRQWGAASPPTEN